MIEIKSPTSYDLRDHDHIIFLGGSLSVSEMINSWRDEVASGLSDYDVTILNPERDDLEDWVDDESNPEFLTHVNWVMSALVHADTVLMYFDPSTESPVSMMEFGMLAKNRNLMVCCPDSFHKSSIVKIVCNEYDVSLSSDKESFMRNIKNHLNGKNLNGNRTSPEPL